MSIPLEDALKCVGPGWADILTRLYAKLPKDVHVLQVKEKFGSLRFYTGGVSPEFSDLIDEAEKESATTCEVCGETGKIMEIGGGWYVCRCPKHKNN
jgi:hypothetical protein